MMVLHKRGGIDEWDDMNFFLFRKIEEGSKCLLEKRTVATCCYVANNVDMAAELLIIYVQMQCTRQQRTFHLLR